MSYAENSEEYYLDVRVSFKLLEDKSKTVFVLSDTLLIEGIVGREGFVDHSDLFEPEIVSCS